MQDDIVRFIFQWVLHMMTYCHMSCQEAVLAVAREANVVIHKHNATHGNYPTYGPTGYLSDNQCVFGSMLLDDVQYTPVTEDITRRIANS